MALVDSALIKMLRSADGGERMRRLGGGWLQAVVNAEGDRRIGADSHERTQDRTTQRNSSRDKLVTTAAGPVAAVMLGVSWQRCRVHCMRNVLTEVSQDHDEMVTRDHPDDLRPDQSE